MKKPIFSFMIPILIMFNISCSSLNSAQENELKEWQAKNLEVKEKQPGTAAGLNFVLGIGDFYNGNIGYGIGNLLTWPLSILWAPIGGASGAREVNYYATKTNVERLENKKRNLKNELESAHMTGQITKDLFILGVKKIDTMELVDFNRNLRIEDVLPAGSAISREPTSNR